MPPRKPPPRTGQRKTSGATRTKVGSYTRADGTKVGAHSRDNNQWKQAGAAWASAGASGAVSLALVAELGFTVLSGLAMLLTALFAAGALLLTEKATRKQRTLRRKIDRNRGRSTRARRR
jgi:hypothetical protein